MNPKSITILICLTLSWSLYAQNWDARLLKTFRESNNWSDANVKRYSNSILWSSMTLPLIEVGLNRFHTQNEEHDWKVALLDAGSSFVLNGVVTLGVKYGVNRKRPFDTYSGYYSPAYLPQDPSFPSGHTSTAFQWATSFSLRNKEWYWVFPAYLYASSIAYTRLALGVHYPTDVIGGVVCGVTSGLVSHWLVNKIGKSKNEPSLKLKD